MLTEGALSDPVQNIGLLTVFRLCAPIFAFAFCIVHLGLVLSDLCSVSQLRPAFGPRSPAMYLGALSSPLFSASAHCGLCVPSLVLVRLTTLTYSRQSSYLDGAEQYKSHTRLSRLEVYSGGIPSGLPCTRHVVWCGIRATGKFLSGRLIFQPLPITC